MILQTNLSRNFTLAAGLLACSLLVAASPAVSQTSTTTPPPAKPATAAGTAAKKPAAAAAAKPGTAKPGSATTTAKKAMPAVVLKTPNDRSSYALGADLGKKLKSQSATINADLVARGIKDALAGAKPALTDDEVHTALVDLQNELRKKAEESAKAEGAKNKVDGEKFLAENKTKEGVVTLPSGLQYKIITAGTGPKPTAADQVECNYRGTLINGKEFDSSYARKQSATFPVSGVIKGWTEALQLMPVGSKWQLFIPPSLAYGDRGAGSAIEPGSTLIFEVELLKIVEKEKPADAPAAKPMDDKKMDDMKKMDEKKPDMPKADAPK